MKRRRELREYLFYEAGLEQQEESSFLSAAHRHVSIESKRVCRRLKLLSIHPKPCPFYLSVVHLFQKALCLLSGKSELQSIHLSTSLEILPYYLSPLDCGVFISVVSMCVYVYSQFSSSPSTPSTPLSHHTKVKSFFLTHRTIHSLYYC